MAQIITMGELLAEIMRTDLDVRLDEVGLFKGPFPSGAPGIFIDVAARLGNSTAMIGGVGNDGFGHAIVERLKSDHVDCSNLCISADKPTGVAFVTYYSNGDRDFLFHIDQTAATEVQVPDESAFADVKYFHIMGCSLMVSNDFAEKILKAMYLAKKNNAQITFDPNIRKELLKDHSVMAIVQEVFENTSVFMPGVDELKLLTQTDDLAEAVKKCFENPNMNILVLKNGSRGSSVYTRNKVYSFDVYPVEVVDSTGAGDTFDATFISGLLNDLPMEEIIKQASAAAALNTSAFGPMEGKISKENIRRLIDAHSDKNVVRL